MKKIKWVWDFVKKWIKSFLKYSFKVKQFRETLLIITAIAGVLFVRKELIVLSEQNYFLERSVKQSYRPIGAIENINLSLLKFSDNPNYIAIETRQDTTPLKSDERYVSIDSIKVSNKGYGLLAHIGHFSFVTDNRLNSGNENLLKCIKENNLIFDLMPETLRLKPYFPNDSTFITPIWRIKKAKFEYFFYVADFNKDQDNNLYCTLLQFYANLKKPIFSYKILDIIKIDSKDINSLTTNAFYYSYTKDEQKELYEYIKSVEDKIPGHQTFAEAIRY